LKTKLISLVFISLYRLWNLSMKCYLDEIEFHFEQQRTKHYEQIKEIAVNEILLPLLTKC